ncbi:hypothetical protein GE21DRAFT_1117898 [Neurospora crassa]|nr:hypothetical protein GE21DRAFT_1117898 [Neurospora crassa]
MDGWMGKGSAIKGPTRERCKRGLGSSGLLFFFLFFFPFFFFFFFFLRLAFRRRRYGRLPSSCLLSVNPL